MDIMTKVRVLWEKVAGITADVSAVDAKATATAATLAGILPRIPADYSTNEVDTGINWIDGKRIFKRTYFGYLPEIETGSINHTWTDETFNPDIIVNIEQLTYRVNNIFSNRYSASYVPTTHTFTLYNVASGYSYGRYICTVFYTKPDPVPAQVDKGTGMITGEDPEPETKKRKTTKKEDK